MVRTSFVFQASHASFPSRPIGTKRRVPAAVSLEHFLQRQRVLGLWRDIVRSTKTIPNESIRTEMRSFAKEEFERNRHVKDPTQIRYLISTGREQMKSMQRYVDEMMDAYPS